MRYTFILLFVISCAPLPEGGDIVRTALAEYEDARIHGVDPHRYIPPGGESRYANAWCGEFTQWVLAQHLPAFEPTHTGTRTLAGVFLKFDATSKDIDDARSGDALFFDLNGEGGTDHIGIFFGRDTDGGVWSIDGNVGGEIVVVRREASAVYWIGRLTDDVKTSPEIAWRE
jgi:hypothetical protein